MSTMISKDKAPFTPKVVLAIGAHPDDIDFGAAGTIAAWAKDGARIEYVVVTDGGKGTADVGTTPEQLVQMRQSEQRSASQTLGVAEVHFLTYPDGELEVTAALKKDLVRLIRQVRPDTVVTLDPTMIYSEKHGTINHSDHRVVGQATLDAIYPLARDHLSFPDLFTDEKLEPFKVAHALLIHLDKHNCLIDVSGTFDLKLAALQCHVSQFTDMNKVGEQVRDIATTLGQEAECEYAESFVRLDLPG